MGRRGDGEFASSSLLTNQRLLQRLSISHIVGACARTANHCAISLHIFDPYLYTNDTQALLSPTHPPVMLHRLVLSAEILRAEHTDKCPWFALFVNLDWDKIVGNFVTGLLPSSDPILELPVDRHECLVQHQALE